MEEQIYLCNLYDYYGELLTVKQQNYFENYYFENLSLKEISENSNVSRNAVHKALKEVEEKLYEYESKLHLLAKKEQLEKILLNVNKDISDQIRKIYE